MTGSTLDVGGETYEIFPIDAPQLPYSLKVLLENLLRHGEDEGARALAAWDPAADPSIEIAYTPARVLMQDFTGVPAIVDLAAMRDAMDELGGDPTKINPLVPVELVIDHSIQVDVFADRAALDFVRPQLAEGETMIRLTASQQMPSSRSYGKDIEVMTRDPLPPRCAGVFADCGGRGRVFILERADGKLRVHSMLGWIA